MDGKTRFFLVSTIGVIITLVLLVVIVLTPDYSVDSVSVEDNVDETRTEEFIETNLSDDQAIPSREEIRIILEDNRDYIGLQERFSGLKEVTVLNYSALERTYEGKADTLRYGDTCNLSNPQSYAESGRHEIYNSRENSVYLLYRAEINDGDRRFLKEVMGVSQEVQDRNQCPRGTLFLE